MGAEEGLVLGSLQDLLPREAEDHGHCHCQEEEGEDSSSLGSPHCFHSSDPHHSKEAEPVETSAVFCPGLLTSSDLPSLQLQEEGEGAKRLEAAGCLQRRMTPPMLASLRLRLLLQGEGAPRHPAPP